jgi:anti-sigma factor RsiW
MSLMQGSTNGPVGNHQQASASQQFFHAQQQSHHAAQSATAHSVDYKPDRPIGYGAFGVVW